MSISNQDLTPISQLQKRYSIKPTALDGRMSALGIRPIKVKRKSFVTDVDLQQLDALAKHLQDGGNINNFHPGPESILTDIVDPTSNSKSEITLATPVELAPASQAEKLAAFFEGIINNRQAPVDPIHNLTARLELLEKAAAHGWLLPTLELAEALNLSPRSVGKNPKFERYGFIFTKVGVHGSQSAWQVGKQVEKSKKKTKR